MSIDNIITRMNFTSVRDSICSLLAKERDNQINLYRAKGYDEEYINKNVNFTIFPKRFRFPDNSDLPCVYVYFNEADIPENEQDIYENKFRFILNLEYYTGGLNDEEDDSGLVYSADENAEDRLNYLTAQIYKILCSEPGNIYSGTDYLATSFTLKRWERILTPRETNSAESLLGARFKFQIAILEQTFYAPAENIDEIYYKADIRDENIY